MREKIEELAKQATASVPKGKLDVAEWIELYNQTFADLVINECISSIEEASKSATYTTFDKGVADTIAARAILAIQNKFK
jgi:hypothetical protein